MTTEMTTVTDKSAVDATIPIVSEACAQLMDPFAQSASAETIGQCAVVLENIYWQDRHRRH